MISSTPAATENTSPNDNTPATQTGLISLVVPLFNEQENVIPLHQAICNVDELRQQEMEMVFVDDGSSDRTLEMLRSLLPTDSRVRVIRLFVNGGQTVAMELGIQASRGEIIVTLDGDLQNDPADIPLLVAKIRAGNDLVVGWRRNRQDRFISRKIPSKVANWLLARFLAIRTHDLGCTLKAYRAELVHGLPLYSDLHRFIPAVCSMASDRMEEVVVRHHPRLRGKSKYGIFRTGRVLLDALTVRMLLSCARRPLRWFGKGAILTLLLALLALVGAIAYRTDAAVESSLVLPGIAMLLGSLGCHLLFAGFLGEAIVRVEPQERIQPLVDVILSE